MEGPNRLTKRATNSIDELRKRRANRQLRSWLKVRHSRQQGQHLTSYGKESKKSKRQRPKIKTLAYRISTTAQYPAYSWSQGQNNAYRVRQQ